MKPDLSAFGDVRLIRPLQGGHRNQVWLVETPSGMAVAKSTRHAVEALKWLEPLHRAARTAGFIVPAFHRTGDGTIVADGFTVEDYYDGHGFRYIDMRQLVSRLSVFHENTLALPQRPSVFGLPEWLHSPMPDLPSDIATLCRAALSPFADAPVHPIHGDITPSNLIHSPDGPVLIDWDEARCDLPFLDFIQVQPRDPAEIRAHLAGEVIAGWALEPAYAQACASKLAHL
jgi:hypothetical protein